MKSIIAMVNQQSGSVPQDGATALGAALAGLGYDAEIVPFGEGDLQEDLARAVARRPDCLIAWGGDGSINCALTACGPDGPPVLALPGGTMNLIHQRLHRDQTGWEAILRSALTDPEVVPWAAGDAGGRRFYVAVMAGRLTQLSESRELVRKGSLVEAIGAAMKSEAFDMSTRLRLKSRSGGQTVTAEATAGAIVLAGDRRPRFDVAAIDPDGPADLVSVALQSLFKGWRDAEDVDVEPAQTVILEDTHGEAIPATLDGEPCELPAVCHIRLVPNAVRVLRARPSA